MMKSLAVFCMFVSLNAFAVKIDYLFTGITITLDNGQKVTVTPEKINVKEVRKVKYSKAFPCSYGTIYQFQAQTEQGEVIFEIIEGTGVISLSPQHTDMNKATNLDTTY